MYDMCFKSLSTGKIYSNKNLGPLIFLNSYVRVKCISINMYYVLYACTFLLFSLFENYLDWLYN